jgi:hypothetical protein
MPPLAGGALADRNVPCLGMCPWNAIGGVFAWQKFDLCMLAAPSPPPPPPTQVQNRIDDLAMGFERLRAMVVGQDPLATALFFSRCLLIAAAACVLGAGRLAFAWWCWEVLRPPRWRAPPGIKGPVQFVSNLPSRSMDE